VNKLGSKKLNPLAAERQSRRMVLDFFENENPLTWTQLWKKANKKGMNYNTFKKHMENLISTSLIKQEMDTSETPAAVKYRRDFERLIDKDIVYFDDVVNFIEKNSKNLDQVFITYFGEIFVSEARGKGIVESLSKTLQYTVRASIHDEWRKEVLCRYSDKERKIIVKYETALMDYMWLHQYLKKENLTKKSIENFENITKLKFYSFSSAKKWISQQKEEPQLYLGMGGFKKPSTKKELKEKKRLESFLAEHEKLYEEFDKEVDNIPKIVAIFPSYSFKGYVKKAYNNILQLPLKDKLELRITEDNKEYFKNILLDYLEFFEDQKIIYRCLICNKLFKKKKKIRYHIKHDEKYSNPDKLIQPLDKKYFEEGLEFLEKNLPVKNNRIDATESSLDRMEKVKPPHENGKTIDNDEPEEPEEGWDEYLKKRGIYSGDKKE